MSHAPDGSPSLAYRADIDGMRAVAVLLVLVFHFELAPAGNAGFIGVDVFFVISGFLITTIIRRQLDDQTFRIGTFYVNRIRRLAPALLAVLLLVLVTGTLTLFPNDLMELSEQTLFAQLYLANLYFWQNVSYFGLASDSVYLLHTWSLGLEEQFYVLCPLVVAALHRYARRHFWTLLALAALASFVLNLVMIGPRPDATFYLLPTRAWELLVGGLIPPLAASWSRSQTLDELLGACGLGLIFAAFLGYSPEIRFPGLFATLPVLGTACLLLSGRGTVVARALSIGAVTFIGKISYSLYLVHWPVNVFVRRWLGEDLALSERLGMFTLSLVVATILWSFVENPFRHRRVLAANGRLLRAYAVGVAATVLIFVVIRQTRGLPQRFGDEVIRLASFTEDKSPPLTECEFSAPHGSPGEPCRIGDAGGEPQWMIYGDSHAWALHGAFDLWLKQRNEAGLFVYLHACPPVIGVHMLNDRGACFAFNESVTGFVDAHLEITKVALVSTWREVTDGALTNAPDVALGRADALRLFDDKLGETLAHHGDRGRQVYVWEPLPGAKRSVPIGMATAAWTGAPVDLEVTRERYLEEFDFFFTALAKHRHRVAASFSPSEALCEIDRCAVSLDGDPLYFDSSHPTRSSARFWIAVMQRGEHSARASVAAGTP